MRHCGIRLQFNYRNSIIHSFVPADLQSPMLTLALMLFHVSVTNIMVFHPIMQAFYSRIANADIQCRRIANPPELEIALLFLQPTSRFNFPLPFHYSSFAHRNSSGMLVSVRCLYP